MRALAVLAPAGQLAISRARVSEALTGFSEDRADVATVLVELGDLASVHLAANAASTGALGPGAPATDAAVDRAVATEA